MGVHGDALFDGFHFLSDVKTWPLAKSVGKRQTEEEDVVKLFLTGWESGWSKGIR